MLAPVLNLLRGASASQEVPLKTSVAWKCLTSDSSRKVSWSKWLCRHLGLVRMRGGGGRLRVLSAFGNANGTSQDSGEMGFLRGSKVVDTA